MNLHAHRDHRGRHSRHPPKKVELPPIIQKRVVPATPLAALKINDRDIFHLAAAAVGEAANNGREGIQAAAAVIINRLKHGAWGHNVDGVISGHKQFEAFDVHGGFGGLESLITNVSKKGTRRLNDLGKMAMREVVDLLSGKKPDPTGGATFFLNRNASRILKNHKDYAQNNGVDADRIKDIAGPRILDHNFYSGQITNVKADPHHPNRKIVSITHYPVPDTKIVYTGKQLAAHFAQQLNNNGVQNTHPQQQMPVDKPRKAELPRPNNIAQHIV